MGRRRVAAALVAATAAVACLAALAASRGRPAELVPQPFLAPYGEFNADEGSAGPRHNFAALGFQAEKAGASQEWLQYSLHHEGTLQQAQAPRRARAPRVATAAPDNGASKGAAHGAANGASAHGAHAGAGQLASKGVIESSGSFQDDDGALFGQDTFDQAQASPGAAPLPYQRDDTGHGSRGEPYYDDDYCEDEHGNKVECEDYCEDEHGNKVECEDDDYCVDDEGYEVPCDEEPEPEPQRPSNFLKSIVKAVSAGALRERAVPARACAYSVNARHSAELLCSASVASCAA
jgi:hypothetical protein